MLKAEIVNVLKTLPIKNCSGIDRIPLRFFNDGKEILAPTILSLMNKIWHTEVIPEVWKITKTKKSLKHSLFLLLYEKSPKNI